MFVFVLITSQFIVPKPAKIKLNLVKKIVHTYRNFKFRKTFALWLKYKRNYDIIIFSFILTFLIQCEISLCVFDKRFERVFCLIELLIQGTTVGKLRS